MLPISRCMSCGVTTPLWLRFSEYTPVITTRCGMRARRTPCATKKIYPPRPPSPPQLPKASVNLTRRTTGTWHFRPNARAPTVRDILAACVLLIHQADGTSGRYHTPFVRPDNFYHVSIHALHALDPFNLHKTTNAGHPR